MNNWVIKKKYLKEHDVELTIFYTEEGFYVGDEERAEYLDKRGIKPTIIDYKHAVCSIGFNKEEQKWYGWSHRAICGFGIGDKVESEDHVCSGTRWDDEYIKEYPNDDLSLPIGFKAKTLMDAYRMAVAFADAVA